MTHNDIAAIAFILSLLALISVGTPLLVVWTLGKLWRWLFPHPRIVVIYKHEEGTHKLQR